jgi:phosphoribosylanthranilate isomerase
MFRIKICGITSVDDALLAIEAGADAIGLNFYGRSPRLVGQDIARRIVEAVGGRAAKIGVFVNASADEVGMAMRDLGLDAVQLHGDEPPAVLAALGNVPVIKAFRIGADGSGPVRDYLGQCREIGVAPKAVLFDARVEGAYGGSGRTSPWGVAADYVAAEGLPPLILAGGLTAENVSEGIRAVRPQAVDTASGVEAGPGRKDAARVRAFVAAAVAAFAAQT